MKKIIQILLCIITLSVNAQSTSHQVQYDDPNKENLAISLDLFSAEFATGEEEKGTEFYAGIGYGLQANYMNLFNRMSIDASFRKNYTWSGDYESSYWETGVTWDLLQKERIESKSITLSESFIGNSTEIISLTGVEMTRMSRFRARGGLTSSNVNIRTPLKINFGYTNIRAKATGVYAGLEFAYNNNFKTSVKGYKMRRDRTAVRVFADVITTPFNGYGDSITAPLSGGLVLSLSDQQISHMDSISMTSSFGYRIGAKYIYSMPNGIAINMDGRIGQKPPYQGIYFYVGSGLTINLATAFKKRNKAKLEDY